MLNGFVFFKDLVKPTLKPPLPLPQQTQSPLLVLGASSFTPTLSLYCGTIFVCCKNMYYSHWSTKELTSQ